MALGAAGLALFVVTSLACLLFVTPGYETCRRQFGHDFLPFYVAGSLAREGRHADLYDLDVIAARERAVAREAGLALGDALGPWWNPPYYAWLFAPLSRLSFSTAVLIWCGINLATLAGALGLLARLCKSAGFRAGVLLPLLVVLSSPFLQSVTHGQSSATALLLVAGIACAWRGGHDFTAGALAGLLLFKPQLAAALAAVLVLHRGRRAAAGLLCVGAALLVVTVVTMPGAIPDYMNRLPQNLHLMQTANPYLWERHVTLKAFWRLLIQGRAVGETIFWVHALTALCALPLAAGLLAAAWRGRRRSAQTGADALLAATVAAAPLLMPFYFDYDLLLLAVPAALTAAHWRPGVADRRLLAAWVVLYLWLFINPYVGAATRVNLAVPLLAGIAASGVLRACRAGSEKRLDTSGDDAATVSARPEPPSRKAA